MTDGGDIERTARGDVAAYRRVVEAHQTRVFALLGRMGLDKASADDIAQETFLRVWRQAHRYDPALGAAKTWVLTIARNAALSALHANARRAEVDADLAPEMASDDPAPDEAMIAAERRAKLARAMRELTPADRALLSASYFDDLSLAEIADIEGCSPGAAKLRLHRARARLRALLGGSDD